MNKTKKHTLELVSGPSKSGKSRWAEKIISKSQNVLYIATSLACEDLSWKLRIKEHKKRRPSHWRLEEDPNDLSSLISSYDVTYSLIIDSLGGFVSKYINLDDNDWNIEENKLIISLSNNERFIVIVSEEVSWGVVPPTRIGNVFRDRISSLTQKIEPLSSNYWLVISGRVINLKKISEAIYD